MEHDCLRLGRLIIATLVLVYRADHMGALCLRTVGWHLATLHHLTLRVATPVALLLAVLASAVGLAAWLLVFRASSAGVLSLEAHLAELLLGSHALVVGIQQCSRVLLVVLFSGVVLLRVLLFLGLVVAFHALVVSGASRSLVFLQVAFPVGVLVGVPVVLVGVKGSLTFALTLAFPVSFAFSLRRLPVSARVVRLAAHVSDPALVLLVRVVVHE